MLLVDAVRELSSTVKNVKKPRQKQAKWILVEFETNEHAEDFKKLLHEKKEIATLKVKLSKLNIKFHDPLNKTDNERQQFTNSLTKKTFTFTNTDKYSNRLMVTNLPENVTKSEIAELFPGHLSIDLKTKQSTMRAFVEYSSVQEAMTGRAQVRPIINGHKIRVILLLLDRSDGFRKRQISDSEKSVDTPPEKKARKETKQNQFVRPLRYFENVIE